MISLIAGGVLLGILIAPPVSTAAESFKDVFVTNDTDHPVPTVAQGTTQVGGTVNIGNAPTVNVGSNPADRVPYQHRVLLSQSEANCTQFVCTAEFPEVPAGQRLVITYASALYTLTSGGTSPTVRVGVNGDPSQPFILLPAPLPISSISYVASGPVTFYVEAGAAPTLSLGGQFVSPLTNTAQASIVGYLVAAS
jgi:hypothetical protein